MKSLWVLVSYIIFSSAEFVVNWSVDYNTLPESLPDLMRNEYYNDEEIKKAVFWAYKFQYDVISEHNGHVFDAESPLGYFKDDLILPKTKVSSTNSDVVFLNNTISGFTNFKSNKIIIKWSQDQVSTEVIWKKLQIEGKYAFLDNLRYTNSKYQIIVEDVRYQVDSPLSKNAELYPLTAPNAAISYNKFKITLNRDYSIPIEYSATRYFLDEVAFRHVADFVLEVTRKNVTSAIRAAVQPYVMYKNRSDPHFPGTTGQLDDGRTFVVSSPFTSGLDNAVQKVIAVWTEPDAGAVMVAVENTLHNLSGTFDLRVLQGAAAQQPGSDGHTVGFAIDRIGLSITYDALKPNCYCVAVVQVYGATVVVRPERGRGDGDQLYETETAVEQQTAVVAFVNTVKDHLSAGTCAAIVKTNKYGSNPFCPSFAP